MKLQAIIVSLLFILSFTSYGKVIKTISINPITKASILPADHFSFYLTVTYEDGKSKKIKSTSSKFRNDFLTESEGCSFHAGQVVINKLRSQIPNNQSTIKVISKDDKNLSAKRTFEIAYFKKVTIKHERSYLDTGDKLLILLEATTNTNEVIQLDKNSLPKKWSWFDIKTSKGAFFDKGTLIVANDVRQLECDTIKLTIYPENADSLKQEIDFIMNYKKSFSTNYDTKHGKPGNDGSTSKSTGSHGTDGTAGELGTSGQNILVYMTIHSCNKNLLKIEVRDTSANKTEYFIINKNGGELKISCNGGDGGDGGDGSNGEKGINAGKTTEPQDGGKGGNGANGGNSGDGGQVTIYSSLEAMPYTGLIHVINEPGRPGKAGKKGKGKNGGKGSVNFPDANEGADGLNGKPGQKAKNGGLPFIFNQKVQMNW